MNIHIQWIDLEILDLKEDNIAHLSTELSDRQRDSQFMKFLKDTPATPEENFLHIQNKLQEERSIYKIIVEQTKKDIVGFILFDNFTKEDESLESYTRVNPRFNGLWIGSQCRRAIIKDLLSAGDIKKIISWHSAWNTWSFIINKRAWFKLVDFVPLNTYLPNIGKTTDDFKRDIQRDDVINPSREVIRRDGESSRIIMQGIEQHNLSHLLK